LRRVSIHTGAKIGKAITRYFYSKPHTKSYYLSCSTGGRQGFKEAQEFHEDFDGIIAGAPALAFSNLSAWSESFYTISGPVGAPTFVSPAQWNALVTPDVMRQCDALDNYADGIVEDPYICKYDPSGLACKPGQNSSTCLTATQVESVRRMHAPLVARDGSLIFPRLNPGSGVPYTLTGTPFSVAEDWFRYAVFNSSTYDVGALSFADIAKAWKIDPGATNNWKGDLSAFKRRGGKLIHFHGHEDAFITSANSARYYDYVSATMKLEPKQLDDFYRFFGISGMGHCVGGHGAWMIGHRTSAVVSLDPDANILMALVRWVEQGVAPDTILGTKYVDDDRTKGLAFQRRHCRYPMRNVYKGTGDPTKPDSWQCILH
jgi:feruloyl esterase